jgi:drug/metabolite transporter (DMT)-like permease
MRKVSWIVAIFLMALTGILGLYNGPRELGSVASSTLQQTVAFGAALYGVLGLVGAVGLARRRSWSVTIAVAWAVSVVYVATVASFAFHDPRFAHRETIIGAVSAFASTVLVGWFVIWSARRGTRAASVAASTSAHPN